MAGIDNFGPFDDQGLFSAPPRVDFKVFYVFHNILMYFHAFYDNLPYFNVFLHILAYFAIFYRICYDLRVILRIYKLLSI